MFMHTFNPSTWDAEASGSPSSRPASSTQLSQFQDCQSFRKSLSQKTRNRKEKIKRRKQERKKKNKTPAEACLTDSLIFYSHGTGSGRQGGWGRLRSRCGTKTNCNIVASETCQTPRDNEEKAGPMPRQEEKLLILICPQLFFEPLFQETPTVGPFSKVRKKTVLPGFWKGSQGSQATFSYTPTPHTPRLLCGQLLEPKESWRSSTVLHCVKNSIQRLRFMHRLCMDGRSDSFTPNNSLIPKVQEIGCRKPLPHKGLLNISVPVPTAVCPSTHTTV